MAGRTAIILLASAVGAAGLALAARTLGVAGTPPALPPDAAVANGPIYFRVGGGDGPSWIDAVEPDGSGRRTVFGAPGTPNRVAQIAWSPDGTRIAYQDPVLDERGIFVADADGGNPVRLTRGANDAWPSWSPDGTTIVFSSSRAEPSVGPCTPGADLRCPTDIYAIGVDGSNLSRLTTDPAPEYQPVWSPDGGAIAFVRTVRVETGSGMLEVPRIFAMDPDGTDVRQVSSGEGRGDEAPSWSPDGTRLVFARWNGGWSIRVVDAERSQERMILGGAWFAYEAEWSPDGELIAFVGNPTAGDYSPEDALYVMRPDGSGIRMLADAPGYGVAGDIAWRPSPVGASPTPPRAEPATMDVEVSTVRGVAEFPSAVAVGEGGVWVTAPSQDDSGGGEVVRLDPGTGEVVARIPIGAAPGWDFGGAGLAVGSGGVWTVGTARAEDGGCCDGLVSRIDPATNAVVDELRVSGITGGDLWVDGDAVYVLGFQSHGPGLELAKVEAATHETRWRVSVPGQWSQTVFVAGGSVWVLGTEPGSRGPIEARSLYAFDPATGALRDRVDVPAIVFTPVVQGDGVWLRTEEGAQRFDPVTMHLDDPVRLGAGCCTGPFVPDGMGGAWLVSTPNGDAGRSIWHLDPSGTVDAVGRVEDEEAFEQMLGQSYAFDPETQTIWVQHYRDSVARVRLVTAEP
ncbi:MAG TPA: hypothetical protein VNO79_10160 [Actinomycetota bacterium]|nr:hypothetical protein [Actinomycetota bacterium]